MMSLSWFWSKVEYSWYFSWQHMIYIKNSYLYYLCLLLFLVCKYDVKPVKAYGGGDLISRHSAWALKIVKAFIETDFLFYLTHLL